MTRAELQRRLVIMAAHVQAAEAELVAAAVISGALVDPTREQIAGFLAASPDFAALQQMAARARLALEAQVGEEIVF